MRSSWQTCQVVLLQTLSFHHPTSHRHGLKPAPSRLSATGEGVPGRGVWSNDWPGDILRMCCQNNGPGMGKLKILRMCVKAGTSRTLDAEGVRWRGLDAARMLYNVLDVDGCFKFWMSRRRPGSQ